MNLTIYKQALEQGERIDFVLSKRKVLILEIILIVVTLASVGMLFTKDPQALVLGIGGMLCAGGSSLLIGYMLKHPMPKVFSINKEFLSVYDLSFSAMLGKKEPCVLIAWNEILRMGIENIQTRNSKNQYIVLECVPPTIEKIQQHKKQESGLLRVYDIRDNLVFLNWESWVDLPLQEIFSLLQETYQSATEHPQ